MQQTQIYVEPSFVAANYAPQSGGQYSGMESDTQYLHQGSSTEYSNTQYTNQRYLNQGYSNSFLDDQRGRGNFYENWRYNTYTNIAALMQLNSKLKFFLLLCSWKKDWLLI